jgi:hypothetical protein
LAEIIEDQMAAAVDRCLDELEVDDAPIATMAAIVGIF